MLKSLLRHKIEYIVFVLFILFYMIIAGFHEPWFDEAQAWQIGRCASIEKMIFLLPHYEGHPPLWWLILSIPAKMGLPFEVGLKMVGMLISVLSAYLIIFCSRIKTRIRMLLPFSFFFFYQYGIIVRPYGLMLLIMILLGQNFKKRNERPWIVIGLMILLCLTSAYGIVVSCGISICMVSELLQEKGLKKFFKEIVVDQRIFSLLILFITALLIVVEIFPKRDTLLTTINSRNSFLISFVCAFFTFLSDCLITNCTWFRTDSVLLQNSNLYQLELICNSLLGVSVFFLVFLSSSRKNFRFFIIPYLMYTLFSAKVYAMAHHEGIALMILIYWLELNFDGNASFEIGNIIINKLFKNKSDQKKLINTYFGFITIGFLVPVCWNIRACMKEIEVDYSYGRKSQKIINEFKLDNLLILSSWSDNTPKYYGVEIGHEDYMNTYDCANTVLTCAYLDHNIFYNLGNGNDNEAYMHYRVADYETSIKTMKEWASKGPPDILFGTPNLKALFGDNLDMNNYSLVFCFEGNYIWKTEEYHGYLPIYMRNDLLDYYHLEPLNSNKYSIVSNFSIDELKKAYENGENIEEMLDLYLDAIFGDDE